MGLLYDVTTGKLDYVHADDDNLSDSRTWPFPKKNNVVINAQKDDGTEEKTEAKTPQEAQDISDSERDEE